MTYTISADGTAITCHRCGLVSYHPMDIATKYCGECRMFHVPHIGEDARSADSLLNEVAALRTALNAACHALLSYAHGNSAPDLALEVVELIESTLKVRADEMKLRASLIAAIERWWESDIADTGVIVPLVGDATLVYMAEQALNVLLAIEDVQTYLHAGGFMVEED